MSERTTMKLQELVIRRLVAARGGDPDSMLDAIRAATKGGVVAAEIIQWAQLRNRLGRMPTVVEYAAHWAISERAAYRHQASIREAFPGDDFGQVVEDTAAALRSIRKRLIGPSHVAIPV